MGFFLALVPIHPTQIARAMCLSRVFLHFLLFRLWHRCIRNSSRNHRHCLCCMCSFCCCCWCFFSLLFFGFLCTRFRFLYIYSIKEMELFVQWSAKVWALWIVIIQLVAGYQWWLIRLDGHRQCFTLTLSPSFCLHFLSSMAVWVVRIIRIMWMSLFTSTAHKKSQQPPLPPPLRRIYGVA